ncbi:MAG: hypothetical protein KGI54_14215 [Pseudomonadota bacterium]|nr:hypothetical protein [Pseudomonadota bacterium]
MYNYYKSGKWNFVCDVCGFRFKSDEGMRRWDGAMVCKDDWELRHPMDFLKGRKEKISVPWVRNEPADQFATIGEGQRVLNGSPLNTTTIN